MNKLTFSGHETFICKQFWLKKGYDFLKKGFSFSDESAVIYLGVGKNMVTAIRYWLKSFGLIDENDKATEFAEYIFSENGADPYLEDMGTIWLLHYSLIKTQKASLYNLFFNEFRKMSSDFQKHSLHNFIKKECLNISPKLYNETTISNDISVFIRSYLKNTEAKVDIEEEMSGLLKELNILKSYKYRSDIDDKMIEILTLKNSVSDEIPFQIILFAILDNKLYDKSISLTELLNGQNSVGKIFLINSEVLIDKIKLMEEKYSSLNFSETAGNQILQFKTKLDKWKVLNDYYKN